MPEYQPPLRDIRFLLENVVSIDALSKFEAFGHVDAESVYGIIEEFGRFMSEVWAPTNEIGDTEGCHVENDTVVTPAVFKTAYAQHVEAGWGAVSADSAYGGGGFPHLVGLIIHEMMNSANMALAMAPMLTQGAIDAIAHHGTEEQREVFMTKMISGEWAGTMNLTEPDAGSDVGALRTRAIPQEDGSYRITGQKIFITFGEQDLTENIIHLVLARTPDAPPGTKGISCFIVPKFMVNDDGSIGDRNDVHIVSIEHKLGIKASPTCTLAFGDKGDGAVGYLIGEENAGMRYMFTMMNAARLGVGCEGLGLAERAYQAAWRFSQERKQGRAPGTPGGQKSFIIEHPDVRRMLMTMKSTVEAMRALCYIVAEQSDVAAHHPDEHARTEASELVDLLIPLAKSWSTDMGETVTSMGIQVHGGMGYIEETGVAQYLRDVKITQIYEGTNGIQAMDLVGRKLPMRGGGVYQDQVARMQATVEELGGGGERLAPIQAELAASIEALETATAWIFENGATDPAEALAAATPYQRLFGTVVAGWLMARSALAAQRLIDAGSEDPYLASKVVTARFFARHMLPEARGLVGPVIAGKEDLMALAPEAMWG